MKCPIDDSPLSVSSREGVEIDFCPQCRGVWLDRGELDKITDRITAAMPSAPAPSYTPAEDRSRHRERDRYDDRDRYEDRGNDDPRRRKKRRSFLDDLFDFD